MASLIASGISWPPEPPPSGLVTTSRDSTFGAYRHCLREAGLRIMARIHEMLPGPPVSPGGPTGGASAERRLPLPAQGP